MYGADPKFHHFGTKSGCRRLVHAEAGPAGGIAEERIVGTEFRSPSAQLRITPLGEIELLSTHDQLLGGPSGQSYLGGRFPADPAYAVEIMQETAKVGRWLGREGVLGRFALDFVAVRQENGQWDVYAIELNLRKRGITYPLRRSSSLRNRWPLWPGAMVGMSDQPFGQFDCCIVTGPPFFL